MEQRAETKYCPRCQETLPVTAFGWRDRDHERRQSYCRACSNSAWREWYRVDKNREHHKRLVAKRRRRRVARHVKLIERLKSVPCQDCGGRFPREAMDFDHVRGAKLGEISKLLSSLGTKRLLEEIAKCDVVCAVCHRIRTQRRADRERRSGRPD